MPASSKKTIVFGASDNPERYSNLAIKRLRSLGHPVIGIGKRRVMVEDVPVQNETSPVPDVDTVSLYLNPNNQKSYYNYILSLHPRRIIFNPGAENAEFQKLAQEHGIQTQEACTLVLLSTGQY
jgi:predicted CoA-binding protein